MLKFFDNSDVTEEANDCTQYYCYSPAKLLALVRCACPVRRDSIHTNEQVRARCRVKVALRHTLVWHMQEVCAIQLCAQSPELLRGVMVRA